MKRTRLFLFRLLLVTLALSGSGAAQAEIVGGKLSNGNWSISDDGVLTVSVSGALSDFKEEVGAPWASYFTLINAVKVNATKIGSYAFRGLSVTSFEAPQTEVIGIYGLAGLTMQTGTLYLPKVKTVELYGFSEAGIQAIVLPVVEEVHSWAFSDLKYSTKIDLGSKIKSLGAELFAMSGIMWDHSMTYTTEPNVFMSAPTPPVFPEDFGKLEYFTSATQSAIYEDHTQKELVIAVPSRLASVYNAGGYCSTANIGVKREMAGRVVSGEPIYDSNHALIGWWNFESIANKELDVSLYGHSPMQQDMPAYTQASAPWSGEIGKATTLTIRGKIKNIPDNLFAGLTSLVKVNLESSTCYVMGNGAFSGCTSLQTFDASKSWLGGGIGNDAFRGCSKLSKFLIERLPTTIGDNAFRGTAIRDVEGLYNVKSIGESAFEGCPLSRARMRNIETIGKRAFYGSNIIDISFGSAIQSIGSEAFTGRQAAAKVMTTNIYVDSQTPPATVGTDAFKDFTKSKTTLHVPQQYASNWVSVAPWNGFMLSSDAYPITGNGWSLSADGILSITQNIASQSNATQAAANNPWLAYIDEVKTILIDNGVTEIGDYAFYHKADGLSQLTTVSVPVSLQKIGSHALQNHDKLITIFVDNVKEMGDEALAGCSSLTRIVLGSQVEKLGNSILADTPEMEQFEINAEEVPEVSDATFNDMGLDYDADGDSGGQSSLRHSRRAANRPPSTGKNTNAYARAVKATVPTKSLVPYLASGGWSRLRYTDAEHGEVLAVHGTGSEYSFFSYVLYADGYLEVSSRQRIVENTDSYNPYNWGSLAGKIKTINVHDGPEVIGHVFNNLPNLESVILPESVTELHETFKGCTSLKAIELPSVKKVGDESMWAYNDRGVFQGCTSLREVHMPCVEYIGNSAFSGCTSLETLDMPVLTKAETYAFRNCAALKEVDLTYCPGVSSGTFEGCTSLQSVKLGGYVAKDAFKNCTALKHVDLGSKISYLMDGAFAGTSLETITSATPNPPYAADLIAANPDPFAGLQKGKITVKVPEHFVKMYKGDKLWQDFNVVADEDYEESAFPIGAMIGNYGLWMLDEEGVLTFDLWAPLTDVDLKDIAYLSRYVRTVLLTDECTSLEKGTLLGSYAVGDNGLNDYPTTELFMGENVSVLGPMKFYYLKNLKHVYCFAPVPPTIEDGGYDYNGPFSWYRFATTNPTLHVLKQEGVKELYEQAYGWQNFPNIVADLEGSVADKLGGASIFYDKDGEKAPWYTIDGRRIQNRPIVPGLYIFGSRKVMMK